MRLSTAKGDTPGAGMMNTWQNKWRYDENGQAYVAFNGQWCAVTVREGDGREVKTVYLTVTDPTVTANGRRLRWKLEVPPEWPGPVRIDRTHARLTLDGFALTCAGVCAHMCRCQLTCLTLDGFALTCAGVSWMIDLSYAPSQALPSDMQLRRF
jgi:hypothetical protein